MIWLIAVDFLYLIFKIMTINDTQDEIIEEFEGLTDWMDRYAYIIDLGNTLPEFPESEKTPQNLIEGCQSRVWITAEKDYRRTHPLPSGFRRAYSQGNCCPVDEGAR